jgi:isopentenyl diphosphate isomerase/L-lactate dehydrogenase-like FMN-dependent dehydrogenase
LDNPVNLYDFQTHARARLDPQVLAYLEGGALDEVTLHENEQAFLRKRLRPRVLRDVSTPDLTSTVLGRSIAVPVGIAPTAQHHLFHADAELAAARAAASAGIPFVGSTMSSISLEEIAQAGGLRWMQLYIQQDRVLTEKLVQRAVAAGYKALVVTVDTPVLGRRERDLRLGSPRQTYANLDDISAEGETLADAAKRLIDPRITWDDIDWLRSTTSLPFVLKGIMTGADASLAVEHGAAAVWVSNHGGRQLDRLPATIDMVAEVVDALAGRAEVYVDGGVRRGLDVAIGLALGARCVFLGRPILYALTCDGERGVAAALRIIEAELANAMALLGAPRVADLERSMVV